MVRHDASDPSGLAELEPWPPGRRPGLTDADALVPSGGDKKALRKQLAPLLKRLDALQRALYAESRQALLIVLQGRDTAGKDGTIRRVLGRLNPQGVRVSSFRAPSAEELAHDYLWRVHQAVPPRGMIGVFNRSHYEDVLVVRVHQLVPPAQWGERFDQINAFESMLSANGVRIVKFFLHISREEQLKRLRSRLDNPERNWKFNPGDLKERDRWDDYTVAYQDVLARCSTPVAPWFVVPADRKPVRDLLVARCLVRTLERMAPQYPAADPAVLALRPALD